MTKTVNVKIKANMKYIKNPIMSSTPGVFVLNALLERALTECFWGLVFAGIIRCQLMEGHIDDAEQQLEFLAEIQQSIGKSGVRNHVNDLLCYLKNQRELLEQRYTVFLQNISTELKKSILVE